MSDELTDIMIIPSIGDPRTTVTSLAMFQNAFEIDPPMPIVVVYGTCPDPFQARGEDGRCLRDWKSPWNPNRWDELRERFKQLADQTHVPILFFDNWAQHQVWEDLKKVARSLSSDLPEGLTENNFVECVDGIFGATYSYGAQRNKAFIVANNLEARYVFFFDDDTFLAPHVGNMIERHRHLLERRNVYAVTGGYFGQRAFNVTIFRKIDEQQDFMGLLGYEIPDDQATQDLWGWRIADGVLGGNFCLKKEVYARVCCPSMHRTPTTDDKLIGREIRRIFGRQGHVYKTGWPVVHVHFPQRMNPREVEPYLKSWARTKAFWVLYDKLNGLETLIDTIENSELSQVEAEAIRTVDEFGSALRDLGKTEQQQASGEVADAIARAANAILNNRTSIVKNVLQDIREYQVLRLCWSFIMKLTRDTAIWTDGNNRFVPLARA